MMKNKMPLDGLGLGHDSGSVHCDMLKMLCFRTAWGGYSALAESCNDGDWKEAISGYWFLPALYYCMLVGSLSHALRHYLGKGKMWNELLIELVFWGIWVAGYYTHIMCHIPFFLHFVKMYPFFVFGTFYLKHSRFRELIKKMKSV